MGRSALIYGPSVLVDETPAGAEIVGVAGGDGSMRGVAGVAIEHDIPFVCVPCGTRNHLARDLGLDLSDPSATLDAFDGVERRIDVGEVDGWVFVNNVSLGAYALLRHGRLGELLDRRRRDAIVGCEPVHAAILLVGSNRYDRLGRRARLDEGVLSIYATAGRGGDRRRGGHAAGTARARGAPAGATRARPARALAPS